MQLWVCADAKVCAGLHGGVCLDVRRKDCGFVCHVEVCVHGLCVCAYGEGSLM